MCDYFNMFTVQHTNLSDEAEIKSKSPLLLPRNKNKRKPKKENKSFNNCQISPIISYEY